MPTKHHILRLDDERWRKLKEIAARVTPEEAIAAHTRSDAGRVTAMLRLIADGRLIVTKPDNPQETQP